MSDQTSERKVLSGVVTSDRMDKTISVDVSRLVQHDRYKKYIKRTSRFQVHDEDEQANEGDQVEIEQTRPLSKNKSWRLRRILKREPGQAGDETGAGNETSETVGDA